MIHIFKPDKKYNFFILVFIMQIDTLFVYVCVCVCVCAKNIYPSISKIPDKSNSIERENV